MATQQIRIRLPEALAHRLRQQVPARQRSAFVQRLLEQALAPVAPEDDPLYLAAVAVEQDERLADEMAAWESTVADGLSVDRPSTGLT